jgi:hypothetical protein
MTLYDFYFVVTLGSFCKCQAAVLQPTALDVPSMIALVADPDDSEVWKVSSRVSLAK